MFYMFRPTSSSLGVPFNDSLAHGTSVKQVTRVDNAVFTFALLLHHLIVNDYKL